MLREIIRQGELRLQAQLQAALAADARAGAMASLQAAASAALIVLGTQDTVSGATEAASYGAAAILLLGSMMAAWAARSVPFDFPGLAPMDWAEAVETDEPEESAMRYYASYLDEYLAANDATMVGNGRLIRVALACLPGAVLVAGLAASVA